MSSTASSSSSSTSTSTKSLPSSFIDVHTFDRKLDGEIKIIILDDKEKVMKYLLDFKEKIKNNPSAVEIFSDMITKSTDIDSVNGINIFNLLVATLYLIDVIKNNTVEDKNRLIKLIEEQLEDVKKLGACPQGRSIRLFQIYKGLYKAYA
jgi:hypothetical protein